MVKRTLLAVSLALFAGTAAQAEHYSIPAGTTLRCRLTQTLTTKLTFQGDPFTATIAEPLVINGQDVIPVGAILEGRVARIERPGRMMGVGRMRLTAEKITFADGRSYPLRAVLLSMEGAEGAKVTNNEGTVNGPGSRRRDLKEIGIVAGAGGLLGTLIGGLHGTLVGGVVGGAVGFVDTLRRRGKELALPSGTELKYQLTAPLELMR